MANDIEALIIQPDGSYEIRVIDQTLTTYRQILGGHLEAVPAGEGAVFWCNEEGKIHGLPRNPMATYLWWKLEPHMEGLDDLRGAVVVTGPTDEDGDSHPVMNAVTDLYRRMHEIKHSAQVSEGRQAP